MNLRGARTEFGLEVLPLVKQLASGFFEVGTEPGAGDFGGVEVVASALGFVGEAGQEGGDSRNRARMRAEARELRVFGVAAGSSLQDFLGEEGLAPGGDETFGVEVAGMEGPESHRRGLTVMSGTVHFLVEHRLAGGALEMMIRLGAATASF